MALSHQWFVQWSAPSLVFTDISNEYNKNNRRWNTELPFNSLGQDGAYYKSNLPQKTHKDELVSNYVSDRTRLTGITLWMTMLGLANTRAAPLLDTPPFATLFKWKQIDFEFQSADHRQEAIETGAYIPENVLPLGLEIWGSRVWVTLPNWRKGVPATLATVSRSAGSDSPLLRPYPDWRYHRGFSGKNNCTGLTSVFRINVDNCGKLWVLDTGGIDALDGLKQMCPPSIVVFDTNTDEIMARYIIPKKYVLQDSLFSNIIVDSRTESCSDLHLYITDTWRFGLLIFRESDASFWRFTHHFFLPDPFSSNYTLHGVNFQWTDGIFGLSLMPAYYHNEKLLFFHSMSGNREFYVQTSVLKNPSRVNDSADEFKVIGESRGPFGQSSASAIDKYGVMFYGLVTRDTVGCWNTKKPYLRKNLGIVAKNDETLIFPNDIKVDHGTRQSVWVLSNRLPMYQEGPLDPDDYNYRILYADTLEAIRGTVCDPNVSSGQTKIIHRGW